MKQKLKISVLFILVIMLAACGNGGSDGTPAKDGGSSKKPVDSAKTSDEKVKLSIWHNFSGDDLRAREVRGLIEKFEAEHPEVELDAQAIPTDGYRQRVKTVAASKELPDVFFVYAGSQTEEFYKAGLLQPLTSLLDEHPDWKNSFLPGATEIYTYSDNEVYSVPVGLSATSFLYYNKSLFEQYDVKVPETWDELMTAVKTFNDNKITPISLGNKANWFAQSAIFGSLADRVTGTEWFEKAVAQDGATFTDPEFVEALNYFKELSDNKAFQEGANSLDSTQAEQYFIQGNAAMMISGSWTLTNLAASATEEQLAQVEVTTIPSIPSGKGEGNTISGGPGAGFALSFRPEGKVKDLALELIYAISGPEGQKAIAESNSMVMYDVEIDESKVSPLYMKAYNLVKKVKFTPVYDAALSSAGTDAINNGLQEIMYGASSEDVAKKLQDAHARAITE